MNVNTSQLHTLQDGEGIAVLTGKIPNDYPVINADITQDDISENKV